MIGFCVRYSLLIATTLVLFINFVACGSQFYKVSVEDDMDTSSVSQAAMDPDSPRYGLHAPNGWNTLPIHFKVGTQLTAAQRAGLLNAMKTWEVAIGKKLFAFDGVHVDRTGDSFKDLFSSLDDFVNGHYEDYDWAKTGKPDLVLATTIWENSSSDFNTIVTSDIRFNGEHYEIGDCFDLTTDGVREVVDMESLALHELGHLLGLAHIKSSYDRESVMNPAVYIGEGLANRVLSPGDLERVQKIYGCAGGACNIEATVVAIYEKDLAHDDEGDGQPVAPLPSYEITN